GVDGWRCISDERFVCVLGPPPAEGGWPVPPVLATAIVDEDVSGQVCGRANRWTTLQESGTAGWKQLFGTQTRDVELRPLSSAVPHGKVNVFPTEVHML